MQSNIERALSDLVVLKQPITVANAFPAYMRIAGFTEVCNEAITSFEHAMDKYPSRAPKSHIVPAKKIRELMTEYWTDKLGVGTTAMICPCASCGQRIIVAKETLEELQHPRKKPPAKTKKARRVRITRDVCAAPALADPYAPSTSAFGL
ncbi:hypothetical protein BV22DRAFT_1084656 [Leucogyrophana mollusca]|uniref:Uncharacterized protein n=1 Tax=Leucogyrophana mollusca TaxID=85980 RepID=A0ACB8BQC0_9AGAM|nr:hypothetical protein BV22DRAFT_1084656 [Leucogyrophana mollusca]